MNWGLDHSKFPGCGTDIRFDSRVQARVEVQALVSCLCLTLVSTLRTISYVPLGPVLDQLPVLVLYLLGYATGVVMRSLDVMINRSLSRDVSLQLFLASWSLCVSLPASLHILFQSLARSLPRLSLSDSNWNRFKYRKFMMRHLMPIIYGGPAPKT